MYSGWIISVWNMANRDVVIVTGASGSMGAAAVRSLSSIGLIVVMACRNLDKAESVRSAILSEQPSADLRPMKLDLSEMNSVREFVYGFTEMKDRDGLRLVALFNNAGVISREYRLTSDGFETTLATNYIGPYLLTQMLLGYFESGSRIVNMVSLTCRFGSVDKDIFERGKERFSRLGTYSDTKLALMLYSIALSRRGRDDVFVNVADPGVVNSNMLSMGKWYDSLADVIFRPFCSSPERGVAPALRALESSEKLRLFKGKSTRPVPDSYLSHPLVDWLYDQTEKILSATSTETSRTI